MRHACHFNSVCNWHFSSLSKNSNFWRRPGYPDGLSKKFQFSIQPCNVEIFYLLHKFFNQKHWASRAWSSIENGSVFEKIFHLLEHCLITCCSLFFLIACLMENTLKRTAFFFHCLQKSMSYQLGMQLTILFCEEKQKIPVIPCGAS